MQPSLTEVLCSHRSKIWSLTEVVIADWSITDVVNCMTMPVTPRSTEDCHISDDSIIKYTREDGIIRRVKFWSNTGRILIKYWSNTL